MFRNGLLRRIPRRFYSRAEQKKIDEDISKYFKVMNEFNSDGTERIPFVQGVSKINQKPSWLGTDQQMMELKEKNAKEEVKAPLTLHTEPLHYSANMGVEDVLKHIYKGTVTSIFTVGELNMVKNQYIFIKFSGYTSGK